MFFNQILHSRKNVCYAYFIILLFAPFFNVLAQAPTISGFSPSSGPIGSLVTITGTNLNSPTAFSIGGTQALVISNTGTSLVGFVMPGAATGVINITTGGGSISSGSNFTVSAPQAITTQIGDKVSGNDNIGVAFQGLPIALSANGNTAIIGGNDDNAGQGAAWVFTKVNGFWSQQGAKLVGTGNIGAASQGISVALSADGNTAAIGGGNDDFGKGAIWIFTRTGSTWTQQGPKLSVTGNTNAAAAGSTLSLSADGNTLLTGAPTENIGVGAGWIFTRSGGVWTQQAKLSGSGTIGQSQIGFSVSLSADGNTAALGGLEDFSGMGAVWVFTRSGTVWSQQGSKLVGTGNIGNAKQGSSIALNANGNFLIVGAGYDDNQKGAAWVFTRSGSTWNQQNKLFGAGASAPSRQGSSVSLNADGSRAAVGGYLDNFGTGSVWLFNRSGSTWSQTLKTAGTGASGSSAQGISLNLCADGQTLGIGGPGDNFNNGATWFFGPIPPAPTITSFTPTTGSDGVVVTLTGTNFTGATSVSFGGTPAQEFTVVNGTTISAMVAAGTSGSVSVTTPGGTGTLPGFIYIFSATPTITSFSPSIGYIGSLVTITGTNLLNPSVFTIGGTPSIIISNTATKLVGMVMPGTTTGLINITTTGGNATSSGNITINPGLNLSAQQGEKLVGSGFSGPSQQGYSVALSADGNTAIVGAPNDNGNKGAAWIYVRTGSNWTQQGSKLTGFGETGNAEQGVSVAISADGNTALVGGWKDDISTGAAWVFTRTGTTWTQQGGKLIGSLNNGASQQGYSVALSADGNTAVLGGQGDNGSNGAIWIFTRSSGVWSQQGPKITVSDNIGVAQLGHSVALSADGNTLAAGGYSDDSDEGASWIFTRSGSVWSQQAKLKGTSSSFSNQGQSVAINANGNTVLIGGNFDNAGAGAAWVFDRTGSTWTQQGGKLTPGGASGPAFFGQSVSLSADGNTASIGGENDNSGRGAGWVFKRTGSTWAQSGSKLVGTGFIGNGKQGWATAVSADANTLMMGGNQDNSNRGAVWVFSQAGPPTITSFTPVQAGVGTTVEIYGANFLGATAVSFGGTPASSFSVVNNSTIQAVVAGGTTGVVSVTTSGGTAGLAGFTFVLPPTITSFTPTSAGSGTSVTITGTNFSTATSVNFGGLAAASFNIINNTTITAIVGSGNSGSVSITNPGGTGSLGGFTFNAGATPTIISFSPSSGSVGTLVTITGTNLANTTAFTMGGVSAIVVSNNGTTLVGMVMPGAATGAISITTAAGTVLSAGNFTVTPTPFPNAQQGSKLVGTGNTGAASQGRSIALSADGNTAIVGGAQDNNQQGAAWVYTRSGTTWSQQGSKLVGTGSSGAARQGWSVAISADGNTAIVGGYSDNTNQGAVWVYTRSGGIWSQQGSKLVGTGNTGAARQGYSVALSADGNTAMVGGYADNSFQGAAWVYTRSGTTWSQQGAKLVGTGNVGAANQGFSVALSADGNTAIVGGYSDNTNQGAVWVYTRSGSTWTQQGLKLVGTGNVGDSSQGASVALSADGNTALVGGFGDNGNLGASWVYTRSGSTWTQQGSKLVGTGNTGIVFQGNSVSLSADGNTAIVGGPFDNTNQGAVWVYTRSGSTWTQQGSKLVGAGIVGNALQGFSVALSADGYTASVGGSSDNSSQGAAWVFVNTPIPTITSFSPSSGSVGTLVTITGTNLGNTTAFTIGGVGAIVVSNSGTSLVGLVMPGANLGPISLSTIGGNVSTQTNFTVIQTPAPIVQQGNKLVGTGSIGTSSQGTSISLSADGNTAIIGAFGDNSGVGAAWVFIRSGTVWNQQGSKLIGTGAIGGSFQGLSISLSADGNTAIVGGPGDNSGAGAAWIFTRTGGLWSQQGNKLIGSGAIGAANQGSSVSLSADGNTAIVGGEFDNSNAGAAWVFIRNGGIWTQQGSKLIGSGAIGVANKGYSVALSADGNTAILGGYGDNTNIGASWVFIRSGGVWNQQGSKLVGSGVVGTSQQGRSVSLSADGNTAIIGGRFDNTFVGAAWVFTRASGIWSQQGSKLVGTGRVGTSRQGTSVSLSADGNKAIVGGSNDNSFMGAAWFYTRSAGIWSQQGSKLVGTGTGGNGAQGRSVSISADGNTCAVGGQSDNSSIGATWIYSLAPPTISFFSPTSATNGEIVTITGTNLSDVTSVSFGGIPASSYSIINSTTLTAVVASGATGSVSINSIGGTASLVGFTFLEKAPSVISFSPSSGSIGTLVSINGINLENLSSLTVGGGNAIVVSNDGSKLVAMVMPGATTGQISLTTIGGSTTTGAIFTVTKTPFPNIQQGSKIVGTGGVGSSLQGSTVSISADGNTAIVGGRGDNGGIGAAWIYIRSGALWTQQGSKLVGTGATGIANQGSSVCLSADGNTALIGGSRDNNFVGAVWIFTRNGTVWTQQGNKLVGTGAVGTSFQGVSASISADGNTAIVGGRGDNNTAGAVWIYTRTGGVWTQQGNKLVGTGSVGDALQGNSVSLSADGNTAIVGGHADNSSAGASWIYTRSGSVWTQQGNKLVGTGAVGAARLGFSVSISADGNTAIAGGFGDNSNVGAGWVFTRSGGVWSQQGSKLTGTGFVGFSFQGHSVSLSADGNTAVLGGYNDDVAVGNGAVWVFTRNVGTWSQQGNKLVGSGAAGASEQGSSVYISADGNTAIVGGNRDNSFIGGSWIYTIGSTTITSFTPTSASVGQTITITGTNFSGVTSVSLGGISASSFVVVNPTTITAVVDSGASGSVSVSTSGGTVSLSGFTFISAPIITSYTPTASGTGLTITINGFNFPGATAVSFGGTAATSFNVVNSNTITAIVASGASGSVSVTTPGGTASLVGFTFIPAPTISSFTPTSAATGTTVTITGSNLIGASSVSFGGTAATSFSVVNSTTITAVVSSGTSGSVTVTTPGGIASLSGFTFIPVPTITSFTPTSAGTGATVTISGTNFSGASAVSFGGAAATSYSVVNSTTITAVVASGTSGSVSVITPGGTASLAGFTFVPAPTISSFTPTSAATGTTVTITGSNLIGASSVSFGGTAATSFSVVNSTTITAVVASGTSGSVTVTTPGGIASLSGFTFIPAPTITSFTPTSAGTGATVTISGTNFTSASAVSFGGAAATSYSVVNSTTITAVVASGTSGSVSVITPGGTASLAGFTFVPAPTVSSFTPTSAVAGATVTLTGTNFTGASSVSFGGTAAASFNVVNSTTITAVVASGTTGSVSVTTPGGTASLAGFTFIPAPTISSFTPTSAGTGATVTLTGTNFTGATQVRFGDSLSTGFLDPSLNPGSGSLGILKLAVQPDGKIIIGTNSSSYNGSTINRICRINSDGSLDGTFSSGSGISGLAGPIAVEIQSDGKILIGGSFATYNGISRAGIARLNADGSLDGSFITGTGTNENNTFHQVQSIAIQGDGKIIIAGNFSVYNGTPINCIARLNSNGSLDATFNPGSGPTGTGSNSVSAAVLQPDGKIIIGGYFTSYNGTARNGIARLNSDGSIDLTFNPITGVGTGDVRNVILQPDGKVLIAGQFSFVNGSAKNRIARLNSNGSTDVGFNIGIGLDQVCSSMLLQSDQKILLGGFFTSFNGTNRNRIVRLNSSGGIDLSFNPGTGTNNYITTLAFQPDGKLLVGGAFTNYNGTTRNSLARISLVETPGGGIPASSFNVINTTTISAVVATGASGLVTVTNPGGTAFLPGFTFIASPPAPTISLFTPTSASTGATVTITGTNFTGVSATSFGGTAAVSFNVVNSTTITAVVASGTTGSVSITTLGGTASLAGFTFIPEPTISSFTPTSAGTGAIVTLTGTNFTGASAVSFGGTAATSFNVVNSTTITAVVASGTSGTVSITTPGGTASLAGFTFIGVPLSPTISSFLPISAISGEVVTITGTNFTGASAVSFGGTAATSFSVVNSTTITAVVALGTSGSVSVTAPGGTASLAGFTFIPAPTLSSFTPTSAGSGATVTLTGTNFNGATSVTFGGTAATSFSVVNSTTITAVVAAGTTGLVSVITPGGTTSLAGFTFFVAPPAPTISSFTPTSAGTGVTVTITGTNFTGASAVSFGGTAATSFNVVDATTITAVVATGTSGSVSVTTPGGTASLAGFTFISSPLFNTWTGTGNWNTPANWSFGTVPLTTESVIVASGTVTVNGNISIQNLTVNGGATVSINNGLLLTISANNVTIQGQVEGPGLLEIAGTNPAITSGPAGSVENIRINTLGGTANLQNPFRLTGTLKLQSGILQTNGNLILVSNASGTARISKIEEGNGADIVGDVIWQRHVPGPAGWRFIGTPIQNQTLATWTDDFGVYSNSFFVHNEGGTLNSGSQVNGWENGTNGGVVGKGYRAFMNSAFMSGTAVIDNTGPITKGLFPFSLSFTPAGYGGGGWNFLANPYPCEVDWHSFTRSAEVDGAIHIFNKTQYGSYSAGSMISVNGVTGYISQGQGFFVKTTSNAATMSVTEDAKPATNQATGFLRTATSTDPVLKFFLQTQNGEKDEMAIAFREDATAGYDKELDAHKFDGLLALSAKSSGNLALSIQCLALNADQTTVVPLQFRVPEAGTYSIRYQLERGEAHYQLWLKDLENGTLTPFENGETINFTTSTTFANQRFELVVMPETTTAANGVQKSQILVYPNPAKDQIHVQSTDQTIGNIEIFNPLGMKMYSSGNQAIGNTILHVKDYPKGLYLIRINSIKGIQEIKILIQ